MRTDPPDAVFFREWDARRPGQRRSLDRARAVRDRLGLAGRHPPVLTVVGSKGKGTTATYASAYLAAAGHRVVTVTSPSLRSTTERLRVDGGAVDGPTLARLGAELDRAIRVLPPPSAGYLSPSGLFTLAGLLLAGQRAAGYLVLEAGRGGASDEVSLVPPAVVAITPIFGEHLAELGGSAAAIVADKTGVVAPDTAAVVVGAQPDPATARRVRAAVAARSAAAVAELGPEPALPDRLLPAGLGAANARLGCRAAAQLLAATGRPEPSRAAVEATLATVSLPGRLSMHRLAGTVLLLDSAVSAVGFRTAREYAADRLGGIDRVLLSLPDDKDLPGAATELSGLPVTFVAVPASHLRYSRARPPGWDTLDVAQLDRAYLAGAGPRLLAMGTGSFVARLVTLLEVPTAVAFVPLAISRDGAPSSHR